MNEKTITIAVSVLFIVATMLNLFLTLKKK